MRDVCRRLLAHVGRDTEATLSVTKRQAPGLARLLSGKLERDGTCRALVLYNAIPPTTRLFATIAGAFSRAGVDSLVQWGPPWWFNDHEQGSRRQLDDVSQIGRLASFVSMVTDSRSSR